MDTTDRDAHAIRVIIADDHPFVRKGLVQFLSESSDIEVIGECSDGMETLEAMSRLSPDVLVLDLRMPRMSGLEVLARMKRNGNSTPVVLLVGNISEDEMLDAMRNGVRGVVLKEMAPELLTQCIHKVAAGGQWLEKQSASRLIERMIRGEESSTRSLAQLTLREREIAASVAKGLSNRAIAEKLFISEATVKSHLHTIYEKLGVESRMKLAVYAREHGLS